MKKTFTANISGTVFHIEEDAYEQLHRYLASIRAKFNGSNGRDEIMADIESRIAELFSERLQGRQVVTMDDVEHVQGIMGQPDDFGDAAAEEGAPHMPPPSAGEPYRGHKRLFRDPDDHWVGGVMGGIAAYFNVDPLWFRIAFIVVMVAGWGSPIVIYLLLWILIPKAETPAERLAMRGEPVTVDNIKRVFDEGAERFTAGAKRMAGEAEQMGRRWSNGAYQQQSQRFGGSVERIFHALGRVIGKLVGFFVLLLGAFLAFVFIATALGGLGLGWNRMTVNGHFPFRALAESWMASDTMANWVWLALSCFLIVPAIALVLGGIRLLFGVHIPRWFAWTLTPIWLISLAALAVMGVRQANEFRQRDSASETIDLTIPANRIFHVKALHDPWAGDGRTRYSDSPDLIDIDGNEVHWGWAVLDVRPSDDTLFHLEVERSAQGINMKEANKRAQSIRYTYTVQDSSIAFSPFYTTDRTDKLRGQKVSSVLYVPIGGAVRFERGSGRIIYDIDNTTNTDDADMVGRTWTMTSAGLKAGTPTEMRDEEQPKKSPQGEPKKGEHHVHISVSALKPSLPGLLESFSASMRP